MTQPDYRGARGSNAGDDFHELWALRQALSLLNQGTQLKAVTVEGLKAEDEVGTSKASWDGVDCAFYYGGESIATASRVVIDQLKYSAADPDKAWTIARLTYSSNKKQSNSVISRLATVFAALKSMRADLNSSGDLIIRLVSNQPVDAEVFEALSGAKTSAQKGRKKTSSISKRAALVKASGLGGDDFEDFVRSLDLSFCGQGSRFALEERVLRTISEWTDDDSRSSLYHLLRFIRSAMMPEARREVITRESILAQLGFSDPKALFPCPSQIKVVDRLIPRDAIRITVEQMLAGEKRICLHGEGGCGKTTALQEIEAKLPEASEVLIYDCYGGGRYLDSDAYRHRPVDAFLQLSNDLASRLKTPLLVSRSEKQDLPRVFKKRMERAAEVIASKNQNALLVIVIDAADNSVTAAATRSPAERSFVHEFVALGGLPYNVRLVVTCRTGRLDTLDLPRDFSRVEIKGFTRDETAAHVRIVWDDAPDTWIDDFDHLSRGNPRVQRYALDYAGEEPAAALDYLRPHGKGLDNVFSEQFEHARQKVGREHDLNEFCAGLVAMPRPISVTDLAAVTGLSEAHIRDLCADLAPGVVVTQEKIGFADEDFEHFVRKVAEPELDRLRENIADHFITRHKIDAYAATHIAAALLDAGRGSEIIDLIKSEQEPAAIGDPVLRREAQLQRLRVAMKVCRETGNNVDAMLTLLIGAEALKTDVAIRNMLVANPDLAANFARDTSSRVVLRDANQIENHGPLIFHLMAADARGGDAISTREGGRQLQAWFQRRNEYFREEKIKFPNMNPHGWSITAQDVAAETEAVLRINGPRSAVDSMRRWKPKRLALQVVSVLSHRLLVSGDKELLRGCVYEGGVREPWDLFLLTPLALAGDQVDVSRLQIDLEKLHRRGFIRVNALERTFNEENPYADFLEVIVTACEVVILRGGNKERVVPILEQLAPPEMRRREQFHTSRASLIDITLRAHTLLERLAGRKPSLDTYFINPPDQAEGVSDKEAARLKRLSGENKEKLDLFVGSFIDLYDVRAQFLLGVESTGEGYDLLRKAVSNSHQEDYRLSREYWLSGMKKRVALSLTRLLVLPDFDRSILFEIACSVLSAIPNPFSESEAKVLDSLAVDPSLHQRILTTVTDRVQAIKGARTSAEEKIEALLRLTRLLAPISHADAESVFNNAITVAGEVDTEVIHEIALFAPLAKRAADAMSMDRRRAVAGNYAIVVSDASIRLDRVDVFPWDKAAEALTQFDVCVALAAAGRWEDADVIGRETFLPQVLGTGLRLNKLSPAIVTSLLPLFEHVKTELIEFILMAIGEKAGQYDVNAIIEEISRLEIICFGHDRQDEVLEALSSVRQNGSPGLWLTSLQQASAFHKTLGQAKSTSTEEQESSIRPRQDIAEMGDPFSGIDWPKYRFVTPNEISEVIELVLAASRQYETFVSTSQTLTRISSVVAIRDRTAHLEALSRVRSLHVEYDEIGRAISTLMQVWRESPSVEKWGREHFLQLILDLLPGLVGYLVYGDSRLEALLKVATLPDERIFSTLLDATVRHVESLSAPTVYALVGLMGNYCSPDDAAKVCELYSDRLVNRIPIRDRDEWDLTDVPNEPKEGAARLLYALMGDIDLRVRWRAAHCARSLARLGVIGVIDELVRQYPNISERSYRRPEAPFYWLAARLWLVIALDRIALESPAAVRRQAGKLLEIATDEVLPHVILRAFAKSAVSKLVESGEIELDGVQQAELERSNSSPIRRKKSRELRDTSFDRYNYVRKKGRRFTFDSMDTLPYWYSGAVRTFASLSNEQFLDVAERWIVDHWGVQNDPWTWEEEPRKDRLDKRPYSSMGHSHGSLPVGERFHTYLEWHAMWCAMGELMRTHPLTKVSEDTYYSFESKVSGALLTLPPLWLADFRSMKPLEERFWFHPEDKVDDWVESVKDLDFLAELQLPNSPDTLIVYSWHTTRARDFDQTTHVSTALVSPDTAASLVRALQTVDEPYDYKIPEAGDELEIEAPPYRLKGWLDRRYADSGIDERDPLRYDVGSVQCAPSEDVIAALELESVYDGCQKWVRIADGAQAFSYNAWSDNRWDDYEERRISDDKVRSEGWRLQVSKESLSKLLTEKGLDLIVEIQITRKNKGYEYSQHNEKKTKEGRFDRVLVLRRDGTIEAAEGRLGSWRTSGP